VTVRFAVRLTPRSAADRIDRVADGVLWCRVTAPPVDGAANDALVRMLARELHVPRTTVRIVSGPAARQKVVEVTGCDGPAVLARWPGLEV
jgi:uncharacterized protein YggU (UPF0235/DUF167 family)